MVTLNTERFLSGDDSTATFNNEKELGDYLDFRKRNDEWFEPFINELACVGIPDEPMFIPGLCKDIEVDRASYSIQIEDIDFQNELNQECFKSTGLFLCMPYGNKMVAFPTRHIAVPSICQRADDFCGTMTRYDKKPNKAVLPVNEKAERLTRDFMLYSDRCKILFRDGKISAALSKEYAILPVDELIEVLMAAVRAEHPKVSFSKGSATHEYVMLEYDLNDTLNEETLRLKLNSRGCAISTIKAGVRFFTSDVGLSSVFVKYVLYVDNLPVVLDGIAMKHKDEASVDLFGEKVSNLGVSIRESEERIEELGNMEISDVAGTIEKVVKKNAGLFPLKIAEEVIAENSIKYGSIGGTGIDVYLALAAIAERSVCTAPLSRYLTVTENCAKLLYLPFDKISEEDKTS